MKNIGVILSMLGCAFSVENADITIYGDGNCFIQESRIVDSIDKTTSSIIIDNLPKNIQQKHIKLDADCINVLSKEIHTKAVSEIEFLKQYVGKSIKLIGYDKHGNIAIEKNAKLISLNNGRLYEIDGKYEFNPPLSPVFDPNEISFHSTPILKCEIENESFPCEVELSYFASGLTWETEYELYVNDSNKGSLSAWYVINNNSETEFNNTSISLLSGTVQQEHSFQPKMMRTLESNSSMDLSTQSHTNDYTIFSLDKNIDLHKNSKKDISFFNLDDISISREYFANHSLRFHSQSNENTMPIKIQYIFDSSDISEFHIPAGSINVYEKYDSKNLFVGSVNISLTQTGEPISLQTGNTVDITAQVSIEAFEINRNKSEIKVNIQLKNTRKNNVTVNWKEHFTGNWEMVNSSHNYNTLNASEIEFEIDIPKNGEEIVSFTTLFKRN